ncbi:MAG: hypothetical protein QME05_04515 [Candidatus Margulisbacteria bacterium]|nr:hypothetical protein [Candidatus Margulisiibacteriota bacterium]
MKKNILHLPIITGPLPEKKRLSMDDYLKFVNFNLKYVVNETAVRELKKKQAVNNPFSLKPIEH